MMQSHVVRWPSPPLMNRFLPSLSPHRSLPSLSPHRFLPSLSPHRSLLSLSPKVKICCKQSKDNQAERKWINLKCDLPRHMLISTTSVYVGYYFVHYTTKASKNLGLFGISHFNMVMLCFTALVVFGFNTYAAKLKITSVLTGASSAVWFLKEVSKFSKNCPEIIDGYKLKQRNLATAIAIAYAILLLHSILLGSGGSPEDHGGAKGLPGPDGGPPENCGGPDSCGGNKGAGSDSSEPPSLKVNSAGAEGGQTGSSLDRKVITEPTADCYIPDRMVAGGSKHGNSQLKISAASCTNELDNKGGESERTDSESPTRNMTRNGPMPYDLYLEAASAVSLLQEGPHEFKPDNVHKSSSKFLVPSSYGEPVEDKVMHVKEKETELVYSKFLKSSKETESLPLSSGLKISLFGSKGIAVLWKRTMDVRKYQSKISLLIESEKTMELQGTAPSKIFCPIINAERKNLLLVSLKQKTSEVPNDDLVKLIPQKWLSGSPRESRNMKETFESTVTEECCNYGNQTESDTADLPHNIIAFELLEQLSSKEQNISLAVENDGNVEKAEAYVKEFEDICSMLKKHEEAKELLARAVVNDKSLLMLNHPMFDEKICLVQKFAVLLISL